MAKVSKQTQASLAGKEELVQAILNVIDRSAERELVAEHLPEFFRGLDEPTLRAIAYQHGAFEEDPEYDRSEERE
jgi:hypothetical protein